MGEVIRLLYVEDDEVDRMAFARYSARQKLPFEIAMAASVSEARRLLRAQRFDAVLLDYELGDGVGLDLFDDIGDTAVVMLTGTGDERVAVEAMKRGAYDYLSKDPAGDYFTTLPIAVENAIQRKHDEQELAQYRQQLEQMVQERTREVRLAYDQLVAEMNERRRAEEALRESEEKYRTLFTSIAGPILVFDRETHCFLDCNQTALDLYGYTLDELRAMTPLDLHPPDQPLVTDWHMDSQEWLVGEYVHVTKNGQLLNVQIHTAPLRYGERPAWISIVRNVSERMRTEKLLDALNRAALAMGQAITRDEIFDAVAGVLEGLGLSCLLMTLDESTHRLMTQHISYDSALLSVAEKIAGIQHGAFSMPVESVEPFRRVVTAKEAVYMPDGTETIRQALPSPLRGLATRIAKILGITGFISAPLIVNDAVIGVLSVQGGDLIQEDMPAVQVFAHQVAAAWHKASLLQDLELNLARLEETQDQLVQSQKMEAIGRLAGGVAHDFNNLLTPILGYTEFALGELRPENPIHADLVEVRNAARRAATLTSQLLAFGRRQIVQPKVLDLHAVVSGLKRMLRRLIGEDVRLVTALHASPSLVCADKGQLEQVLVNLSINARDAMPQGGTLRIETRSVALDAAFCEEYAHVRPGRHVRLSISDTGTGMSEQVQDHLFEPFYTTKEEGRGTGLGLATVYGIVEQSEGCIEVLTELGMGTTLRVYLPQAEGEVEVAQESAPTADSPRGSETILVVEDEEMVRALTSRVLRRQGYAVLEASHPGEALLIHEQHPGRISLLLTDVVMPGMSGTQLAERLADARPEMRVLYMSGHADDVIARQRATEGDLAMISKPFSPNELTARVRQMLDAP